MKIAEYWDRWSKLYEKAAELNAEQVLELIECEKVIAEWLIGKQKSAAEELQYYSEMLVKFRNSASHWRKLVEDSLNG